MANFHGHQMTRVGQNLMAKLMATGRPVAYSSVKVGDGVLGSRLISELTGLISIKASFSIAATPIRSGDGRWNVTAIFKNSDLTSGFRWREWGVFARDPDTTLEVLMIYANSGDTADYVHAWTGADDSSYVEEQITCACVVSSELTVTAELDPTQLYVPQEDFNAHVGDKNNPHGVTASQAGARPNTWTPTAADVGARPSTWMPTAADVGARPDSWVPTAVDVGATPSSHATDAAIHVKAEEKTAWGGKAEKPRLITLTIPATGWAPATTPDWQQVTVAVPGLADGSVIDLQPTDAQLNQLSTDGVGIIRADNVTGACVIKCKDAVPTVAMTVQATITEVRA